MAWYDSLIRFSAPKPTEKLQTQPAQAINSTPTDVLATRNGGDDTGDITTKTIQAAIEGANGGETSDLANIAESILDRDAIIQSHWQTRRNAVLSKGWDVVAIDEGNAEKAMELRKALDKANIRRLVSILTDVPWYGWAGAWVEWAGDGTISRFVPIHASKFRFDDAGNPALMADNKTDTKLQSLPAGQVVFSKNSEHIVPGRSGICRSACWIWLFKRNAMAQRADLVDRFGSPIVNVKVTEEQWKDRSGILSLMTRIRDSIRKGVFITPEGASLSFENPVTNSSNTDIASFIQSLNDDITLVILGQKATSGDAGGLSKGQAQENVRLDILASDCERIMSVVKLQVLDNMAAFMFGENYRDAFEFKIAYEGGDDLASMATMIKTLSDAGYKADRQWVSEEFSIPLGEEEETPAQPMAQVGKPAQPPQDDMGDDMEEEKTSAMSDSPTQLAAQDEFVSRVTDAALRRLFTSTEAMAEFYRPLKNEIAQAFSDIDLESPDLVDAFSKRAEKFFEKYPSLYHQMVNESGDFQKVFQGAVLTAATGGKTK